MPGAMGGAAPVNYGPAIQETIPTPAGVPQARYLPSSSTQGFVPLGSRASFYRPYPTSAIPASIERY